MDEPFSLRGQPRDGVDPHLADLLRAADPHCFRYHVFQPFTMSNKLQFSSVLLPTSVRASLTRAVLRRFASMARIQLSPQWRTGAGWENRLHSHTLASRRWLGKQASQSYSCAQAQKEARSLLMWSCAGQSHTSLRPNCTFFPGALYIHQTLQTGNLPLVLHCTFFPGVLYTHQILQRGNLPLVLSERRRKDGSGSDVSVIFLVLTLAASYFMTR